ncbi:MAG: type II toxin-antitoxin system RelE/ParE family toxin [Cyclobacteriaceae bacterium]
MAFKIKVEPEALDDIQQSIDWYNEKQAGLGRKFLAEVKSCFKSLKVNPFFQVRYDEVRCLPLKKFPFMIHFTVHEADKVVVIRAVFNTYLYPDKWENRK